MKHIIARIPFLAAIFAFVTGLYSCNEDTILNANLVPSGDTVNSIIIPDTITIYSKTVMSDSALTSLTVSGLTIHHALGNLVTDPYSGKTKAGIYVQVVPPQLNFKFPENTTIDSAVLILPYSGFTWGDTTGLLPQEFTVHEISDSLIKNDSVKYYSESVVAFNPEVLGTGSINSYAGLKDSVSDNGSKRAPHFRIKLSSSFINKINNVSDDNMSAYAKFLGYFRGFYIQPSASNSGGNALFYFRLNGSYDYLRAGVLFYYKQDTTVKTASFFYNPDYCVHYNRISRDYSSTPTGTLMASANVSDSVFVLQNEPGAALDVIVPYIKNLPKKPINKAELIITQYSFVGDNADKYFGPARLYPQRVNTDGTLTPVQDRYPLTYTEPLAFMDGTKKSVTIAGITFTQYTLNIPREVQTAIVEQKDKLHLRIVGASGYPGAYRLIGGGGNRSDANLKIKLNVVFSKI
ncbi:MAG TPA: DUF4270 family protein [Flavipsychrobacter sp.]|nr:DUF4270 family protein [Flavipsychrobacter sp.]